MGTPVNIKFTAESQDVINTIKTIQNAVNSLSTSVNIDPSGSFTGITESVKNIEQSFARIDSTLMQTIERFNEVADAINDIETSKFESMAVGIDSINEKIDDTVKLAQDLAQVNIAFESPSQDDSSLQNIVEIQDNLNNALQDYLGTQREVNQTYQEAESRAERILMLQEELNAVRAELNRRGIQTSEDPNQSINTDYLDNITQSQDQLTDAVGRTEQARDNAARSERIYSEASQRTAQIVSEKERVEKEELEQFRKKVKSYDDSLKNIESFNKAINNTLKGVEAGAKAINILTLGLSRKNRTILGVVKVSRSASKQFDRYIQVTRASATALEYFVDTGLRGHGVISQFTTAVRTNQLTVEGVLDTFQKAIAVVTFFLDVIEQTGPVLEEFSSSLKQRSGLLGRLGESFAQASKSVTSFTKAGRDVLAIVNRSAPSFIKYGKAFSEYVTPTAGEAGGISDVADFQQKLNAAMESGVGATQSAAKAQSDYAEAAAKSAVEEEKLTEAAEEGSDIREKAGNVAQIASEVLSKAIQRIRGEQEETNEASRGLLRVWSRIAIIVTAAIYAYNNLTNATNSLVGGIIETTRRFQTMQATLRVTERDVGFVSNQLIALNRVVTGITLDTLLQGFTQLRIAGTTVQQAQVNLEAIAKSTAELGKTTDVTARVVTQLTQAYASNVAEAQDLKIIFREIPQISAAATRALGVQIQGWKDLAQAVRDNANLDLRTALSRTLTELNVTAIGGDPRTFGVQLERFQENMADVRRSIGSELIPALTSGLRAVNEWLNSGSFQALTVTMNELRKTIIPLGIAIFAVFKVEKYRVIFNAFVFGFRNVAVRSVRYLLDLRRNIFSALQNAGGPFEALAKVMDIFGKSIVDLGKRGLSLLISQLRRLGKAILSLIARIGPLVLAIGTIVVAWRAWFDTLEANRKALKLQEESIKSYRAVVLDLAEALVTVSETDNFRVLRDFQQRLIDQTKEYQQEIQNADTFWNNFIDRVANRRSALNIFSGVDPLTSNVGRVTGISQDAISNLNRQYELINQVIKDNATEESRINALLELRRVAESNARRQLVQVYAARARYEENFKSVHLEDLRIQEKIYELAQNHTDEIDRQIKAIKERGEAEEKARSAPRPITLAQSAANIRDLQDALNTAREGRDVGAIQEATRNLVEAYSREAQLRAENARLTIDIEDKSAKEIKKINERLAADIFEIYDANVRRRNAAIDETAKRLEELRSERLLPLPDAGGATRFREALKEAEEIAKSISGAQTTIQVLRSSASRVFRLIGRESQSLADDFIFSFNQVNIAIDAFVNRFRSVHSVVRELRDIGSLVFPDLISGIDKLTESFGNLNKRQRELLPVIAQYRATAVSALNTVTNPLRSFADDFRRSSLSGILRPGVNVEGRRLQREEAKKQLEELNKESERLNREELQKAQQRFSNAFSNIERAFSSIDFSESVIENIKRISTAFLASTARILIESKISYLIQKKFDDDLTAAKIANLAKVGAAFSAFNAGQIAGAAGSGVTQAAGIATSVASPFAALLSAPLSLIINNVIGNRTVETVNQKAKFNFSEGL